MTNFVSVATSAARYQDISLNPQKLAGQCAKLKCCLNYEVDTYVECVKQMPSKEIRLETKQHTYYLFKTDVFNKMLTYSTEKNAPADLVTIPAERAFCRYRVKQTRREARQSVGRRRLGKNVERICRYCRAR